jgi:hypothetical protein
VTAQTARTRNDHGAERIFGADIDRNTYQIHRDSYSAICVSSDLRHRRCWSL